MLSCQRGRLPADYTAKHQSRALGKLRVLPGAFWLWNVPYDLAEESKPARQVVSAIASRTRPVLVPVRNPGRESVFTCIRKGVKRREGGRGFSSRHSADSVR